MNYKKEIENLQNQIDKLKEELKIEQYRRIKIDPYKQKPYDLKPTQWGIQVDKSNATKSIPMRGKPFSKESGLNRCD